MQRVSREYKESMKSPLRERGYIMITFGLVNQEAQAKATIGQGRYSYFSDISNIFGRKSNELAYATLEENFTRVDGTMLFLPRENTNAMYSDTGIISERMVSDERFELTINLNTGMTDFKGLTINFGENYPVDFDIVSSTGQVIEFRDNSKSKWNTEEVLANTTSIKLII